jgi:DNA-binding MarR family transcriptional regulator
MAIPVEATGLSELEQGAWRGLLRAHTTLVKALDAELEEHHGMPLSSYEVLMVLWFAPDRRLRMSDLAAQVLLSRSGVTRLVDRLEKDGLLERVTCSSDGRGCFASLTDEGAQTLESMRPTHLAGVRANFVAHFSDDELGLLTQYWERVSPTQQA